MKIKTEKDGNKVRIFTPYNSDFVKRVKLLCGKWNADKRCWVIPELALEDAREAMREIYGEDDLSDVEKEVVTLSFREEVSELRDSVQLLGRVIATAYGRDSGAKSGDEVAFISGSPKSGGSRINWYTVVPEGCVVRIFNVPKTMISADKLPEGVFLVSSEPIAAQAENTLEKKVREALEIGKIKTDSDIEDLAEELSFPVGDVEKMVWTILSDGTPCAGCKNACYKGSGMFPCNLCSRNEQIKDRYEGRE